MDDSSMDLTAVCNTNDEAKRELIVTHEKNEALFQENHELRKKIQRVENINFDLENDLTHLSNAKKKELSKLLSTQSQLDSANLKVEKLESLLEDERLKIQRLIIERNENIEKDPSIKAVVVPDQEQLNILTGQIQNFEVIHEQDIQTINDLIDEKNGFQQIIHNLQYERQNLQDELSELKELLKQKSNDLRNANETLESTREEKLLLSTELQILKGSDSNASRGNSLFAEVEENRQKVAAQREALKLKYINLKKVLSQKQVENNKLKLEIVKIRREENDDEKKIHQDYSDLIRTYKERVSELEERLRTLEQKTSTSSVVSDAENSQFNWVNTVVETARKETQNLQTELDRRGSNYVVQGHILFDSKKENRRLKAINLKMQSEIDELRLELDIMKSANENIDDGISPPATDIAIAYQKQKTVRFKEVLQERSNTSIPEEYDSKENMKPYSPA